jgi:hypothetical protein
MANDLELIGGIKPVNPVPVDAYYGPYSSAAAACTGVPLAVRAKGIRKVGIVQPDGSVADFWWNDGITDADLVPYAPDLDLLLAGKASIPDGLIEVGSLVVNSTNNQAFITGFAMNYQQVPATLPDYTLQLSAPHAQYPRLDAIYYNPAVSVYGYVSGAAHENPILDIPSIPASTLLLGMVQRKPDGTNVYSASIVTKLLDNTSNGQQANGSIQFNNDIAPDRSKRERLLVSRGIDTPTAGRFYYHDNLYHNSFPTMADPDAQVGYAIVVPKNTTGGIIYGPYVQLPNGAYVCTVYLKVDDNAVNSGIGTIDVAENGVRIQGAFIDLKATDFKAANQWQAFKIPFFARQAVGDHYEFRYYAANPMPCKLSYDYCNIFTGDYIPAIDISGKADKKISFYTHRKLDHSA